MEQQQMKLAGLLQGGGISVSVGNGSGDSDEDIVVAHQGRRAGAQARRASSCAAGALRNQLP